MSEPVSGNYNDLFDIEVQFQEITATLKQADIAVDSLFINADAGFNAKKLRGQCGDKGIMANVAHNRRNSDKVSFD